MFHGVRTDKCEFVITGKDSETCLCNCITLFLHKSLLMMQAILCCILKKTFKNFHMYAVLFVICTVGSDGSSRYHHTEMVFKLCRVILCVSLYLTRPVHMQAENRQCNILHRDSLSSHVSWSAREWNQSLNEM